jgi:hypothetical protein
LTLQGAYLPPYFVQLPESLTSSPTPETKRFSCSA